MLALWLAGCKSPPAYIGADHLYYQDRPRELYAAYAPAERDPEINSLVGIDKMLSAALLAGDWAEAERLAELASSRVNIFLAGERGERDALSFLGREKDKPFKGEPHERAMADFYLGLLRFRRGEHEGALNCFLSALAKDRGVYRLPAERGRAQRGGEGEATVIYAADYAAIALLAARSLAHIDEPEEAARYLAEAKAVRPELAPLFDRAMDPENNVLVVIEAGRAPEKVKQGPRGEVLSYRRGGGAALQAVRIDGAPLDFGLGEDLYLQATTLGGRSVDELNRRKAAGQEAIKAAGAATAVAGSVLASSGDHHRNRRMQTAGLIALGAGVAAMIFAETAVDPSADTRAWSTLPECIYLAVGRSRPGEHQVEVDARGEHGGDLSQRWTEVPVAEGRPTLLWFRLLPGRRGGVYPVEGNTTPLQRLEEVSGKES